MRKLFTLLLTIALGLAFLPASPALAQITQDVTITHLGTPGEFLALARSFVKQHLAILNTRTEVSRALTGRPPYTEGDVESASPARIKLGVSMIVQDFFEKTSQAFDDGAADRLADLTIRTPVRDRGDQTAVDGDFEEPPP